MREFGDCEQGVKRHARVSRSAWVLSFSEVGSITGGGGGKECSGEFRIRKQLSKEVWARHRFRHSAYGVCRLASAV